MGEELQIFREQQYKRLQVKDDPTIGALVVYASKEFTSATVAIVKSGDKNISFRANVVARTIDGMEICAALFPRIKAGDYYVDLLQKMALITVFEGEVAEVDFRE